MASTVHILLFGGFIFAILQSVRPESSYEWDVEKSSVNPLSYTDEAHYSRDWTTGSPVLESYKERINCSENEHYSPCDANCEDTCGNYNKPKPCPKACIWGCVCNSGLVRGPDEKCIEPKDCPANPNAEAQQSVTENPQFEETEIPSNSETENTPPPLSNHFHSLMCRKNEEKVMFPSTCQDDCNNFRDEGRKCYKIFLPSCICKRRFVRSPDGKCIRPFECYKEKNFCPEGEEYSPCHSHCEDECVKGKEDKNICKTDRMKCVSGCTCKEGLVRGTDGTCIYRTECTTDPSKEPHTKVCPENEVYENCTAACQRNCSNIESALPCPRSCQAGCICKNTMVRGKYGKCVEKDECPKGDSSPDFYVTLNPPPYTDNDYHIPESVTKNSPNSVIENQQFEETEIPPISDLEPHPECPPRERWVPCGAHCQRNCSNKDDTDFSCRPVCIPGCICKEGLVKGPDGKCIEKEECPAQSDSERNFYVTLNPPPYTDNDYHIPESATKNSPNSVIENQQFEETEIPPISDLEPHPECPPRERWVPCGAHCQRNCSNKDDKDFRCRPVCIPGCICEEGLVKGPDGKCIEKGECPAQSDSERNHFSSIMCLENETLSPFTNTCKDDCNNSMDKKRKCYTILLPSCICKRGFVRSPDGKCIEPSKCYKEIIPCTGKNEWETKNGGNCERNCSNWAFNLVCPDKAVKGCACKSGYVRGPNRKCITWSECPSIASRYPDAASTEIPPPKEYTDKDFHTSVNPCPDGQACQKMCKEVSKTGGCGGPGNSICKCV